MVWLRTIGQRLLTWGLALGGLWLWAALAVEALASRPAAVPLRVRVAGALVSFVGGLVAITVLRPAWWSGRAHRRVMLPLGLSITAPILGFFVILFAEHEALFRSGTRGPLSSPAPLLLGLGLMALLVRVIHGQRHQRHFAGLVRALGLGGAGLLGLLLLVASAKKIVRSSTGLDELPSRAVFGAMVSGAGAEVAPRKNSREEHLDHDWAEVGSEAEPLSLHRVCGRSSCWFGFRRVPTEDEPFMLGTGPITMTSDEPQGLIYLSDGQSTLVYLSRTLQPLPGGVAQTSWRLSAPWSWLVGASGALALIGLLQAYRRRVQAWAEVLAGASAGRVEDGWVRFRGDRPDEQAPPGFAPGSRVIVLPGQEARTDDYRSSRALPEGEVLKGHQGILLEKAWANVSAIDALCFSLAALAAAPLLAGLALGLLF